MLMITEVSLSAGCTRTPGTICLWNHSTMFPPSVPASPDSRWHYHLCKPPGISQEEPGSERQSCCFKTSAEVPGEAAATAVRLTAEEIPRSQKQPSLLLRASPAPVCHAGSVCLAATRWPSSQLPVCQSRSNRHAATVNVCWRWRDLARSRLQPHSLPEPCRGSEAVGSLVTWEE